MPNPVVSARSRLGRLYRDESPDPERVAAARRELAEAKLNRAIQEAVSGLPPLTEEQRRRCAALLLSGGE